MNKLFCVVACLFFCVKVFAGADDLPKWTKDVGAKSFPGKRAIFDAGKYGAKGDSITLNTVAIQKAIDACSKAGGGIVCFRPGIYLTGSLFLKSNVHLRVDDGVVIKGSDKLVDYPEIDTRVAGIEMKWPAALINVNGQKNVAITGRGTINANGKHCWDAYWALRREYEPKGLRWIVDYDSKRVRTLVIDNSEDVTVKDLTLQQAGFWTVQILYATRVTVDAITIQNNIGGSGPSTDGIDVDSSTWVLVQNCDIDCNDDNFCLKAGRDWDGLRVNRPTEYVVIRDCISRKGGGLITFGSETSGSIRHVVAYNLKAAGTQVGLRFKSATTRGGVVEHILLQDIEMEEVRTAIEVTQNWNPSYSYSKMPAGIDEHTAPAHWKTMLMPVTPPEKGIPQLRYVIIRNVVVKHAGKAIFVDGLEAGKAEAFYLENININADVAGSINWAKDWKVSNVEIKAKDGKAVQLTNTTGVDL